MKGQDNSDKSDRIKVIVEQFKPEPGKMCSYPEEDHYIEAEFKLNGNLYCPSHFEIVKFEQKELGHEISIKRNDDEL